MDDNAEPDPSLKRLPGNGRPALGEELRRSELVNIRMRPGERDDLDRLADAWGVPMAVAAWALLSDLLAELRHEARLPGGAGDIIRAASRRMLETDELERGK